MSRAQVNLLNWGFPFPDDSIAHAAAARLSLSFRLGRDECGISS